MTSFAEKLSLLYRRTILDALAENNGCAMNEQSIKIVLRHFGHVLDGEMVRAQLDALKTHGLIQIERLSGDGRELWMATLTEAGADVQGGVSHVAVARKSLA